MAATIDKLAWLILLCAVAGAGAGIAIETYRGDMFWVLFAVGLFAISRALRWWKARKT